MMLDEIVSFVGKWGDETFKDSTAETVLSHMREEIAELSESKDPEEAADVFLLLCHFCYKSGISLGDVAAAKFKKNQARTWKSEPEPGGHWKHEVPE